MTTHSNQAVAPRTQMLKPAPSLRGVKEEIEKIHKVLGEDWQKIYPSVMCKITKGTPSFNEIELTPFLWSDEQLQLLMDGIPKFFGQIDMADVEESWALPELDASLHLLNSKLYFQKAGVSVLLASIQARDTDECISHVCHVTDEAYLWVWAKSKRSAPSSPTISLFAIQYREEGEAMEMLRSIVNIIQQLYLPVSQVLK